MVDTFHKQQRYTTLEEAFHALYSFLKQQNWAMVDTDGDFETPTLVDGNWFVTQAAKDYASGKSERLELKVTLDLTNKQWSFVLSPQGGWDKDTNTFKKPYTSTVNLPLNGVVLPTEYICTFIENSTRFIIWVEYNNTHSLGYFGEFTPFQDVETVDEWPSLMGAGSFSQDGLDGSFVRISPIDDAEPLSNGTKYTNTAALVTGFQPNKASGKYDELAYQVYFTQTNFQELSGILNGIRLCSVDLGPKDTLAMRTRLNVGGLTIPWDGTTPV